MHPCHTKHYSVSSRKKTITTMTMTIKWCDNKHHVCVCEWILLFRGSDSSVKWKKNGKKRNGSTWVNHHTHTNTQTRFNRFFVFVFCFCFGCFHFISFRVHTIYTPQITSSSLNYPLILLEFFFGFKFFFSNCYNQRYFQNAVNFLNFCKKKKNFYSHPGS